jgi:hypothetical protein
VRTPPHQRPITRPATRRRFLLGLTTLVACASSALTACDPPGSPDAAPPTGCGAAVAEASAAVEVSEQVRLLDVALVTCRSYEALTGELARYPGIIGYDAATFVSLRCTRVTDDAVRSSPTCATVIAPATTTPQTTLPDVVYVGDTLDGRQFEIRPSATTEFVGDVPAVVQQTVDIALESGCDGLIEQRDLWAARVDDPTIGDEASVYAKHAQNVAVYIGCDVTLIDEAPTG